MTDAEMRETIDGMLVRHFPDPFSGSVSEWCCHIDENGEPNLRFDEAENHGPFTLTGREYMREPLDDWGEKHYHNCVEVFGSQSGKTTMLMGGAAWSIICDPCGLLWTMPSQQLAQSFSETRWQPMLRASRVTKDLIPSGAQRHDFKKLQQQLGASCVNFIGSNSPANLAGRPARKVVLDEVDKFDKGGKGEADAVNLAEQRVKDKAYTQIRKTSTPTLFDGLIWQDFRKGDQRRYHVPCPHCGKLIVFGWSEKFYTLSKTGVESWVTWDNEAKRDKGWDLDRVDRSARIECCHCGGHIQDGKKPWMIANGIWKPTEQSECGYRSRQLSSLYACGPGTTIGKMALKFLQAKQSLLGLQGFINGDLAEPYTAQDSSLVGINTVERIELSDSKAIRILTVDYQQTHPRFWYVVREWRASESIALDAGPLETWEEVESKQKEHGVKNIDVFVDSGFQERKEFPEVQRECAQRVETIEERQDGCPLAICWWPVKGFSTNQRWKNTQTGIKEPFGTEFLDPWIGTADQGKLVVMRFMFASDYFKDRLWELRQGMVDYKWSVLKSVATDEYRKHMSAEYKESVVNHRTGRVENNWKCRSHWPNHLFDCENMQVAAAYYYGLLKLEIGKDK